MGLQRTTEPKQDAVTLAEVKRHSRIEIPDDDPDVLRYLRTATRACEEFTHRQFITASWTYTLDEWPADNVVYLPRPKLISVTSLTYYKSDGTTATLTPGTDFQVDTLHEPARLFRLPTGTWPTVQEKRLNAITIVYQSGYGATPATVPEPIRQAIALLTAHYFENREPIAATMATTLPYTVDWLLTPFAIQEYC